MRHPAPRSWFLTICGLCCALIPVSALWTNRPLSASTPGDLIQSGLQIQNQSRIARLKNSRIGWDALRHQMLSSGADEKDAENVIRVAKARMAPPFKYGLATGALRPVFVKPASLGTQKVWLIQAAAPAKPFYFDCGTGVTMWMRYRVRQRNTEICAHRVLIIQSRAPYTVLASKDIRR